MPILSFETVVQGRTGSSWQSFEMKSFLFFTVFLVIKINVALGQTKPKWCVTSAAGKVKCDNLASQLSGRFTCVLGNDEKDCYQKVVSKAADFGVFDGGMIYHAGRDHNLKPIMAEKLSSASTSETAYYAVAVVKAGLRRTINTIGGHKSCHTGVQKTSGWIIPVGALLSKDIMKWKGCDQYSTVAGFFSQSCAPGANDKKYNPSGKARDQLCSLCSGSGDDKCSRSSKEPYYGYDGAFKCLKEGKGDVAFIKASILTALPADEQSKYKLLCLDDTTKDPKDYASCNLARVSSHAVLTRPDAPVSSYQKLLQDIDGKLKEGSGGPLKYDGTLFSKSTTGLDAVPTARQSYDKYLDTGYMKAVSALEKCVRFCAPSSNAFVDCLPISNQVNHFECINGTSEEDCYMKISKKEADVGMFDGGAIYHAGKNLKLKPIMAEKLSTSGASETAYYAIAVVKANSKLTINSLKGTKSCHTGVQKTSGWVVPVGHFVRTKKISLSADCDQYGAVSNFFSASCAPGANNDRYNKKKTGADKLCSLCSGNGANKCSRSKMEPYYGYSGAFKCLSDGKGDVAFIKQGIIPIGQESQYNLLCRDGTLKDPSDYKTCNLARVPSHAMLARADAPVNVYQEIFTIAFNKMGQKLFQPAGSLFSNNVNALSNITTAKQSFSAYLDDAYMKDIAALDCVTSSASTLRFQFSFLAFLIILYKVFV